MTVTRRPDRLQDELKKYRSELTIDTHESTLEAKAPRDFTDTLVSSIRITMRAK